MPRLLWVAGAVAVALHLAHTVLALGGHEPTPFFATWLAFGAFLLAAATCLARSARGGDERATWLAIGVGLFTYSFGLLYYNLALADDPPTSFPSLADLAWLSLYPAALVALVLLVRSQAQGIRFDSWLDGLIGGLAMASVGVTVLFEVALSGPVAAPAANLTFALCDLLLVGFAVAAWGLYGWRPSRSLLLLTLGFAALGVQDSVYLYELVRGSLTPGTFLDSAWLAVILGIAAGAALRPRPARGARTSGAQLVVVPFVFALTAVALGAYLTLSSEMNTLTACLNTATLVAVVVRFALTARSHLAMLAVSRHEALTDALTGLGNRRSLLQDLQGTLGRATTDHQSVLALFDLDGFKGYNDSYGHPSGDALLSRLGRRLAEAIDGRGAAYRMGGDEFCVLAFAGPKGPEATVASAAAALAEHGEGFTITCSYGSVVLPTEARDPSEALRLADRRMYARKYSARTSPARQSTDVLVHLMSERNRALGTHMEETTRLCEAVAHELGLPPEEMGPLSQAAALHDVGKAAIPDAILNKPGPLTDEDWTFMRRHTVIGERILGVAPALSRAAKLVRWSHERVDGRGYPDGLAGEQIPLAARIIAACDAYDAMTADRPYRRAMSPEVALAELRHCAGTQFDPTVVEALREVLAGGEEAALPGDLLHPTGQRRT